jgi:hypothetical protein
MASIIGSSAVRKSVCNSEAGAVARAGVCGMTVLGAHSSSDPVYGGYRK